MSPEELYLLEIIQSLLRVRGLDRGIRGHDAKLVREAAKRLIDKYGRQQAMLGLFGLANAKLESLTGSFIGEVYEHLVRSDIIPAARGAEMRETKKRLADAIRKYQAGLLAVTASSQRDVMIAVRAGQVAGINAATDAAGITFSIARFDNFTDGVRDWVSTARPGVNPLNVTINNAFSGIDKAVDKWIDNMEGRPARQVAYEMFEKMIGKNNMPGATAIGNRGTQIRRAVQKIGAVEEILPFQATGLQAKSQRILISELQSVQHQSSLYANAKSPSTKYVKWSVSNVHHELPSSPDICDVLEQASMIHAGKGLYRPETCPSHPHPHCRCSVSPKVLPVEQWSDDFGEPIRPDKVAGTYTRRILEEASVKSKFGPNLTPKRLENITAQMNNLNQYGYERYKLVGL